VEDDNMLIRCNNKNPPASSFLTSGPFLLEELLDAVREHIEPAILRFGIRD
jgi:hypothetical protein